MDQPEGEGLSARGSGADCVVQAAVASIGMELEIQQHMVEFLDPSGEPCGGGLLLPPRQVLTCAHVVNAALGLAGGGREMPEGIVRVRNRATGSTTTGRTCRWRPMDDENPLEDMAIVELDQRMDPSAPPPVIRQLREGQLLQQPHVAHAYGAANPWRADGTLGPPASAKPWFTFTQQTERLPVKEGFSGFPVDASTQSSSGFVGLLVDEKERIEDEEDGDANRFDRRYSVIPLALFDKAFPGRLNWPITRDKRPLDPQTIATLCIRLAEAIHEINQDELDAAIAGCHDLFAVEPGMRDRPVYEVLAYLGSFGGPLTSGRVPVLDFVYELCGARGLAIPDPLQTAINSIEGELGLSNYRPQVADRPTTSYLMVDLRPDGPAEHGDCATMPFEVAAWFRLGKDEGRLLEPTRSTIGELGDQISDGLQRLRDGGLLTRQSFLTIEVFVPKTCLELGIEHLIVEPQQCLGTRYAVVVRIRERAIRLGASEDEWQKQWEHGVKHHGHPLGNACERLDAHDLTRQRVTRCQKHAFVMNTSPFSTNCTKSLDVIEYMGIARAVWARLHCKNNNQWIQGLLDEPLESLPETLLALRQTTSTKLDVVLLWDDPTRLPQAFHDERAPRVRPFRFPSRSSQ